MVNPAGLSRTASATAIVASLIVFAASGMLAASNGARLWASRPSTAAGQADAVSREPTVAGPDWRSIGASVQGRPILSASFGTGERRILIIGGIHGQEFGSDVAEAFAGWLFAHPEAVPPGSRIDVVGCANPDGRAARRPGNAHQVNLNGNFPARNWRPQDYRSTTAGPRAGSEPETQALLRMLRTGYVRVVSLHSEGGFVDYDGPGGLTLARDVAKASGMPAKKLGPPSMYTGSLGSYVPEAYHVPVLTIELLSREMTRRVLAGLLTAVR